MRFYIKVVRDCIELGKEETETSKKFVVLLQDNMIVISRGGVSLLDMYDLATPTCPSNCMIFLFLKSRLSFSVLISASCCAIVPLQASRAAFSNSCCGLMTAMLEFLCLMELLGYLVV